MQLTVYAPRLDDRDHLIQLATLRARRALGRLADRIARVVVHLQDVNGPKGGRSRRCVAEVALADGRLVLARDLGLLWEHSMRNALERAATEVLRVVGRARALARR
jgi:hypothetical protein